MASFFESIPRHGCVMPILLTIHTVLLAYQGTINAPNVDELAHLPSGLAHWKFGNFTLYRVNPPLIRMIAALPLLVNEPQTDWSVADGGPYSRPEFAVGSRFLKVNGSTTFRYVTHARYMLIPVSLLGMLVCHQFANQLFASPAGLWAATLWAFSPNMLGWGATINPDVGAATFGVLCGWRFYCWLERPDWKNVAFAGVTLGLALLTKTTWFLLFALWPLLWLAWGRWRTPFRQLIAILLLGLYVLNLGYGFEGFGRRLGHFKFISQTLGGATAHQTPGNRFSDSVIQALPLPLPANFASGIDVQKFDFETRKRSYLRGEFRRGGWWYYYLYGIAVKTPLGFLALGALALGVMIFCRRSHDDHDGPRWRRELVLLAPAVAVILLVSSQTGFNRHLRYVLPAYPFLFVFASRLGSMTSQRNLRFAVVRYGLLLAGIGSSLWVYPYCQSYFNFAVGGPANGHRHLLHSNIDWGQDLLRVKAWSELNAHARPVYYIHREFITPADVGMQCRIADRMLSDSVTKKFSPRPGWYVVSIHGLYEQHGYYRYLRRLTPVDRIGYSHFVYYISANNRRGTTLGK